jgi:hypothetical protein
MALPAEDERPCAKAASAAACANKEPLNDNIEARTAVANLFGVMATSWIQRL